MVTNRDYVSLRYLSIGSILFGIGGAAFFWWLPLGMIFSLTGMMLGFVDCVSARRRSMDFRIDIVGGEGDALFLKLAKPGNGSDMGSDDPDLDRALDLGPSGIREEANHHETNETGTENLPFHLCSSFSDRLVESFQ